MSGSASWSYIIEVISTVDDIGFARYSKTIFKQLCVEYRIRKCGVRPSQAAGMRLCIL